jgi:hypothetical protein
MGKWKGVKNDIRKTQSCLLFDLERDPAEREDIASRFPQIIREMEAIVKKEYQQPLLKEWSFFWKIL